MLVALGILLSVAAPAAALARSEGEDLFELSCSSCHTAGEGEPSKFGPNLFGVLGRPSGAASDYQYSSALSGGKVVWTQPTLDKFLESPSGAVPGTSMPFGGLADPAQRAEIIGFLKDSAARETRLAHPSTTPPQQGPDGAGSCPQTNGRQACP